MQPFAELGGGASPRAGSLQPGLGRGEGVGSAEGKSAGTWVCNDGWEGKAWGVLPSNAAHQPGTLPLGSQCRVSHCVLLR